MKSILFVLVFAFSFQSWAKAKTPQRDGKSAEKRLVVLKLLSANENRGQLLRVLGRHLSASDVGFLRRKADKHHISFRNKMPLWVKSEFQMEFGDKREPLVWDGNKKALSFRGQLFSYDPK